MKKGRKALIYARNFAFYTVTVIIIFDSNESPMDAKDIG